ncbi:MAG: AraC family transcriptional regulator [Clostridiales bacterium]|nr:AraC family transcriptional regulator [Clostridiales bacterium]
MDWVYVIQETLRYMEENLLTVTSPKEVALKVHVSASYLQTSFQMITGFSIGEYIRNRRLYLAAMELLEKDVKVIDISEKYGYETPESFTKAFSRFHDATPNEIKKEKKPIKAFLPLKLSFSVKGADTVDVVIEKSPKMRLIGKADLFSNDTCFQVIPGYVEGFWREQSKKGFFPEPFRGFYGVSVGESYDVLNASGEPWLNDYSESDAQKISFAEKFLFLVGIDYDGREVPEGMHVIEIPETLWAKFRCKDDSVKALQDLRVYIFREWLLDTDEYEPAGEFNVEYYEVPNEDGKGTHNEIWLPVRRSKSI